MAYKKNEAVKLGVCAGLNRPYDKFSVEDVNEAFRDQVKELVGDYNLYRRNKLDFFELMQEIYAEILPKKALEFYGSLAEFVHVANGQKSVFRKKLGRARGKSFVTRVGLGGVFETFRLDSTEFTVETFAIGGAAYVDFERFLAGQENLAELMDILLEGMNEEILRIIAGAINASKDSVGLLKDPTATGNMAPDRTWETGNRTYVEAVDFDAAEFDKLIAVVRNYGDPVIVCTQVFASKIPANYVTVGGKEAGYTGVRIAEQDVNDMRQYGVLRMYKGCPIVIIPNSFVDETNRETLIDDSYAYVVPSQGTKLCRLVFEGSPVVDDYKQKDRSMEISMYQKVGVAILHTNNWGLYHDSALQNYFD